jgi:hypothetical protein
MRCALCPMPGRVRSADYAAVDAQRTRGHRRQSPTLKVIDDHC